MAQTNLVKGEDLTPELKKQVLAAFIYRNTKENEARVKQMLGDRANGMKFPETDEEWIKSHAFYVVGGRLSNREKRCEPVYMAESANESGKSNGTPILKLGAKIKLTIGRMNVAGTNIDMSPSTLKLEQIRQEDENIYDFFGKNGNNISYSETNLKKKISNGEIIITEHRTNESDDSVWITGETMLRSKNPDYKGKAYPFANMKNGNEVYVNDIDNGGNMMFLGKDSDVEVVHEGKYTKKLARLRERKGESPIPTFEAFSEKLAIISEGTVEGYTATHVATQDDSNDFPGCYFKKGDSGYFDNGTIRILTGDHAGTVMDYNYKGGQNGPEVGIYWGPIKA